MGGSSAIESGGMGMMSGLSFGFSAIVGIIIAFVIIMAINQLGVAAITYGTVQDLRDLGAHTGKDDAFAAALRSLRDRHARKPSFVQRLAKEGLVA
jgi:hypothetical protein